MTTLMGIDLSNYQGGAVDWDAIKAAGYQFACIKATEGIDYQDPDFPRNWSEAKRVGIVRIAYHFGHLDINSADAEVAYHNNYVASAGGFQPTDGDALDLESGVGNLAAATLAWLQGDQATAGFAPLLYGGTWFFVPHDITAPAFAAYKLWYASWQTSLPPAPAPWNAITVWQNSASATVPGVPGVCDTDVFEGNTAALLQIGMPQPTPPAPVLKPFDTAARLNLCGFAAGGSGVADLTAWLGQYTD